MGVRETDPITANVVITSNGSERVVHLCFDPLESQSIYGQNKDFSLAIYKLPQNTHRIQVFHLMTSHTSIEQWCNWCYNTGGLIIICTLVSYVYLHNDYK